MLSQYTLFCLNLTLIDISPFGLHDPPVKILAYICLYAASFYVLTFQVNTSRSFWYIICIHITLRSGAMGSQSQLMIEFYKYEIL